MEVRYNVVSLRLGLQIPKTSIFTLVKDWTISYILSQLNESSIATYSLYGSYLVTHPS